MTILNNKVLGFLLLLVSYTNYAQIETITNLSDLKKIQINEENDTRAGGGEDMDPSQSTSAGIEDEDEDTDSIDTVPPPNENNDNSSDSDIMPLIIKNTANSDFYLNNSVSLIPNPTKNIVKVNSKIKIYKIEIYNVYGVLQDVTKNNSIDMTTYKNGIYLMKIFTENTKIFTKTVIKR